MNKKQYYLQETIHAITRHGFMSALSVSIIAISIFVFGCFSSLISNVEFLANSLESQLEINVYLDKENNLVKNDEIEDEIKGLKNIKEVSFIDKNDSFEYLITMLEKERAGISSGLLIENPLPDSFHVSVNNPKEIEETAMEINRLKGVESVSYGKDIVDNVFLFSNVIRFVSLSMILILFTATIFIITNTIKISVHARKKEIQIMKYIGAKDSFIYIPYLLEGAVLGFCGSFLSVLLFRIGYAIGIAKIHTMVSFLEFMPVFPYLTNLSFEMILVGSFLGAMGSYFAVKKYTRIY